MHHKSLLIILKSIDEGCHPYLNFQQELNKTRLNANNNWEHCLYENSIEWFFKATDQPFTIYRQTKKERERETEMHVFNTWKPLANIFNKRKVYRGS